MVLNLIDLLIVQQPYYKLAAWCIHNHIILHHMPCVCEDYGDDSYHGNRLFTPPPPRLRVQPERRPVAHRSPERPGELRHADHRWRRGVHRADCHPHPDHHRGHLLLWRSGVTQKNLLLLHCRCSQVQQNVLVALYNRGTIGLTLTLLNNGSIHFI